MVPPVLLGLAGTLPLPPLAVLATAPMLHTSIVTADWDTMPASASNNQIMIYIYIDCYIICKPSGGPAQPTFERTVGRGIGTMYWST